MMGKEATYVETIYATGASKVLEVIQNPPVPQVDFSASTLSGFTPLTVNSADSSTNNPTRWRWRFGDGSEATQPYPSHTFDKSGIYSVSLISCNKTGVGEVINKSVHVSNLISASCYVYVGFGVVASLSLKSPLSADFIINPEFIRIGDVVQFTDYSAGSPTSWLWDFGDGTSSTLQNPTHVYDTPSEVYPSLTVSRDGMSDTKVSSYYIVIRGLPY